LQIQHVGYTIARFCLYISYRMNSKVQCMYCSLQYHALVICDCTRQLLLALPELVGGNKGRELCFGLIVEEKW
jgi:hypothetical protein